MPTFTATFDRIGRDRSPSPVTVEADDADDLAKAIFKHVTGRLHSSDIDVEVDLEQGAGRLLAGGRPAGSFTIATDGQSITVAAPEPRASLDLFGSDHWSTFAYVETRTVDHDGEIDHDRMRCDPSRHPTEYAAKRFVSLNAADGSSYPTLLKHGKRLGDHDDYDCLADLQAVGLVTRVSLSQWQLTPLGRAVAAQLREYKAAGGNWLSFTPTLA